MQCANHSPNYSQKWVRERERERACAFRSRCVYLSSFDLEMVCCAFGCWSGLAGICYSLLFIRRFYVALCVQRERAHVCVCVRWCTERVRRAHGLAVDTSCVPSILQLHWPGNEKESFDIIAFRECLFHVTRSLGANDHFGFTTENVAKTKKKKRRGKTITHETRASKCIIKWSFCKDRNSVEYERERKKNTTEIGPLKMRINDIVVSSFASSFKSFASSSHSLAFFLSLSQ